MKEKRYNVTKIWVKHMLEFTNCPNVEAAMLNFEECRCREWKDISKGLLNKLRETEKLVTTSKRRGLESWVSDMKRTLLVKHAKTCSTNKYGGSLSKPNKCDCWLEELKAMEKCEPLGDNILVNQDGFIWRKLTDRQAISMWDAEALTLYAVYSDGTESQIETKSDLAHSLTEDNNICIEVGYLPGREPASDQGKCKYSAGIVKQK